MFYLIAIPLCVLIAAGVRFAADPVFTPEGILVPLGIAALAACAVIALDGVLAFAIRRLPEGWFRADAPLFRVSRGERLLYRRLGVCVWKDYVPELGAFSGFRKNKLVSVSDTEYLARFLMESNYGVAIHLSNALVGAVLPFIPLFGAPVGITVAVANLFFSILPCMILRYHTPPLTRLWRRGLRKEEALCEAACGEQI